MKSFVAVCVAGVLGISAVAMAVELIEETRLADDDALYVRFGEEADGTLFPKYVLFADRFEERDASGDVVSSMSLPIQAPGDYIVPSKEGRFFALVHEEWPDRFSGRAIATVYGSDDAAVHQFEWPRVEGEGSLEFEVSDFDGTVAPTKVRVERSLLRRPSGQQQPVPRAYDLDFAVESPLLAGAAIHDGGSLHVWVADLDGTVSWERTETRPATGWSIVAAVRAVRMSRDGSFVAVVDMSAGRGRSSTSLYVYGPNGERIIARTFAGEWNNSRRVYEGGYVYGLGFSASGNVLAIALTDEVIAVDLPTGSQRYRTDLSTAGNPVPRRTMRVAANNLGEAAVIVAEQQQEAPGEWEYVRPHVFLLSSDGVLVLDHAVILPPSSRIPLWTRTRPDGKWRPEAGVRLSPSELAVTVGSTRYGFGK